MNCNMKANQKDSLNSYCTIAEAVQLARGVAEDVVSDYNNQQRHLQIAISLQIEILKDLLIKAGITSEEELRELYMKKAEEFNKLQQEAFSNSESAGDDEGDSPKMEIKSNSIEVTKS